jgi:hypothetical protein
MTLKEFIQNEVLLQRLKKNDVLVVYDSDKRYRDLCLELNSDKLRVVDASNSSITSREDAIDVLNELGSPGFAREGMIVYVQAKHPVSDEDKQIDPFALYSVCGKSFPDSDGDDYINLCLKFKPDFATEIRGVFNENPNPGFAVIDAIGGGIGWPVLRSLLDADSTKDILFALLAPSDAQKSALNSQTAWVSETKDLLSSCLGMKLLTKGKTLSSISDELWRFILFSEFVFDLPEKLPAALENVPHAKDEAKILVEDLCDRLRNNKLTQETYISNASRIEHDLNLPDSCFSIENLGVRDTFPFEERSFLVQAMKAFDQDNLDKAKEILSCRENSIWMGRGESQTQWGLIGSSIRLWEACDDYERQLSDNVQNINKLIDFYTGNLREVDRLHREFEQAVYDCIDAHIVLSDVVDKSNNRYRKLISKVQSFFINHVEKSGWPPSGRLANADVFDSFVKPKLMESGRKVAYILVDALRYELGVALEKQLSEDCQVEIKPAFAQLPSITKVGMASLLPEAGNLLSIEKQDGELVPFIGKAKLNNVTQRLDLFKQKYGERFFDMTLSSLFTTKKVPAAAVDLLVIRSNEIDNHFETAWESAFGLIQDVLKKIRVAINKLKGWGFNDVIIVTDHGFFLNAHAEAGDLCTKPNGDWIFVHDRLALGSGSKDSANWVMSANSLGIRGDFKNAAGPYAMVPYKTGEVYMHGGLSLQECVVPVLLIKAGEERAQQKKVSIKITYKNGSTTRITSRFPVVDLIWEAPQMELFSSGKDLEIILEAHNKKNEIVGEAKTGGIVNPATGAITLKPGEAVKVTIKMQEEFEGKCTVKILNPTTLAVYAKIDLETDYTV